jgi:hypothetical protein
MKRGFREYEKRVQGGFREGSGRVQEHEGHIQGT